MLVKICGIQTKATAHYVSKANADFIGFVFAPSKRQISPQLALEISTDLPDTIKKVGVFVNESLETIIEIAEQVKLDIIQLHGDESPAFVENVPYETIKAFSIDQVDEEILANYSANYYLIDSPSEIYRGGSGKTFNWEAIEKLSKLDNLILAGGLSAINVQQAIKMTNPTGVDVSTNIETNGVKDHQKISEFIANAKGSV